MINTSGYTVGSNRPLTHARILWQFLGGTVAADGTDGALALNDFPFQRWAAAAGAANWTLTTAATASVDCLFVAAHNFAGTTLAVATSATTDGSFTTRASFSVPDNNAICVLFNTAGGAAHSIRRLRLTLGEGEGRTAGIIRAGVALQMQQPFYGGHGVITRNRRTTLRDAESETGNWIGRMVQRRALAATYQWSHIKPDWYRDNFEPFALTLPGAPFGIAGNPARMPDDVGWVKAQSDPAPAKMGLRDFEEFSLAVSGFF